MPSEVAYTSKWSHGREQLLSSHPFLSHLFDFHRDDIFNAHWFFLSLAPFTQRVVGINWSVAIYGLPPGVPMRLRPDFTLAGPLVVFAKQSLPKEVATSKRTNTDLAID